MRVKRNEMNCSRVRSVLVQKSNVFRQLCIDRSDGASLMAGERLFQARAAATHRKCMVAERLASGDCVVECWNAD